MRRPFSSTRVDCLPRLRSEAPEAPEAKELLPPMSDSVPDELVADSESSISRTLVAPVRVMSSRRRVCTGETPSASICFRRLPVTSTRCMSFEEAAGAGAAADWANTGETAAAQAAAIRVRWKTRRWVEYRAFM